MHRHDSPWRAWNSVPSTRQPIFRAAGSCSAHPLRVFQLPEWPSCPRHVFEKRDWPEVRETATTGGGSIEGTPYLSSTDWAWLSGTHGFVRLPCTLCTSASCPWSGVKAGSSGRRAAQVGSDFSCPHLCSASWERRCVQDGTTVHGTVFSPGRVSSIRRGMNTRSRAWGAGRQSKQNAAGFSAGWAHGSSDVPQRCCSQSYRSACRPEELVTPAATSTCSSAAAPCPVWSGKPLGTSVLCAVPGSPFGFPSLPLRPNPWPLAPANPCRGSFTRSPVRQSSH